MFSKSLTAAVITATCLAATPGLADDSKMEEQPQAAMKDATTTTPFMGREETMKMIDEAIASNDAAQMKAALVKMKEQMIARGGRMSGARMGGAPIPADKMSGDKMSKDAEQMDSKRKM